MIQEFNCSWTAKGGKKIRTCILFENSFKITDFTRANKHFIPSRKP
jgi:hypothetical protein